MAEQREHEQRRSVPVRLPALIARKHHYQDGRGGERSPGPGRPTGALSADQWVQEQRQGGGHEHDTARIELEAAGCTRFPHEPPREGHGDRTDGQVHEKHRAPPEPKQVGADQQAAEHLARDHPEPDDDAVDRVGETLLARRERHLDERQRLWDHHGGEGSLQHPRPHQRGWRAGKATECGRDREARHTDHIHPPAPVEIAEPTAGDQQHGKRQRVPCNDQLHLAEVRSQPALNGRDGDRDDVEVEGGKEYRAEHHCQRSPASGVHARRCCTRCARRDCLRLAQPAVWFPRSSARLPASTVGCSARLIAARPLLLGFDIPYLHEAKDG